MVLSTARPPDISVVIITIINVATDVAAREGEAKISLLLIPTEININKQKKQHARGWFVFSKRGIGRRKSDWLTAGYRSNVTVPFL